MRVFIANFGLENYLWEECRRRSTIAVIEFEDLWPLRDAGDRDAYISRAIATKITSAGISPTRPVASRWFNLHDIVEATHDDLWIHREKNELWWTISRAERPEVVIQQAHKPAVEGDRVYVIHKPAEPWSNLTRRGNRLEWPALHPRAQDFLFTEGTLQQLASDNAAYAVALINGDDQESWHQQPAWRTKAEVARRGGGTVFNAKQRAISRMVQTVRETVAGANGQQVLRNVKSKELRFQNAQVFENYLTRLFDSQEGLCALTGIPLQLDGEHDDAELLCSVDRIDSVGHYELGNLQIVCRFVNRWKNDDYDANFRRLLSLARSHETTS